MDEEGRMRFAADSDSEITRGFCSCLISVLDGALPEEVLKVNTEDLGDLNVGLPGAQRSRVNTWHNVLISMQKKTKALLADREGKVPFDPFPSLVITEDGIQAKGSYAEAQARYLLPDKLKEKWMDLFPSIVSKARTVQVISSDQAINGSLQLMYAELQVVTPLVPTREAHFLRYCQQNAQEGTWVVVDFPIDSLNYENSLDYSSSFPKYKRRCSGCVIQDMPNGYSRVTWVEHAEIEDKPIHQTFSHLVSSGMAFGARRWLAVLQRQCERLASLMARNISDLGASPRFDPILSSVGCSLADVVATPAYTSYLEAAYASTPSLHVVYINTSPP